MDKYIKVKDLFYALDKAEPDLYATYGDDDNWVNSLWKKSAFSLANIKEVIHKVPGINIVTCDKCARLDKCGDCRVNRNSDGSRKEKRVDGFCDLGLEELDERM